MLHSTRSMERIAPAIAILALCAASAFAEQLWLSQSASFHPVDSLRLNFSNTTYCEHGKHFANEEAVSFRQTVSEHWSAGAGITWGQDKIEKHWERSDRPTEHVSFDWLHDFGDWTVFDAQRFDLMFREGERNWVIYRNIGTLFAPTIPNIPWSPRPYLTQQIYFSTRECFTGFDRFSQYRAGPGVRLNPANHFFLSTYWQYRDIELPDGEWVQFRIIGISAALAF